VSGESCIAILFVVSAGGVVQCKADVGSGGSQSIALDILLVSSRMTAVWTDRQ